MFFQKCLIEPCKTIGPHIVKNNRFVFYINLLKNLNHCSLQGYCFPSPCGKQKVMICLACARTMRGKKELKKLVPGTMFFCASGSEEGNNLSMSPFKCLNVKKVRVVLIVSQHLYILIWSHIHLSLLRCFEALEICIWTLSSELDLQFYLIEFHSPSDYRLKRGAIISSFGLWCKGMIWTQRSILVRT